MGGGRSKRWSGPRAGTRPALCTPMSEWTAHDEAGGHSGVPRDVRSFNAKPQGLVPAAETNYFEHHAVTRA
jgi:hypothetical protein